MAATIMEGLWVDRDVSSATLKPDGVVLATNSESGKLSFVRLDPGARQAKEKTQRSLRLRKR